MLRKTAYFFHVFAIMYSYASSGLKSNARHLEHLEQDSLAKSARHASVSQASVYYNRAQSEWESCGFHEPDMWQDYKVSKFRTVFYAKGNRVLPNPNPLTRTTKTLPELAQWYVKDGLGFRADYDWKDAYDKALKSESNKTSVECLRDLLRPFPPVVKTL
jgi:hypothetical protein